MAILQKDLVAENDHPVNLVEGETIDEVSVTRPPIFEVYMRMAEELAKRSTCARLKVGTVITGPHLENVVAIGYNGNARRFPNECDGPTPGACGCIHSEQNALVKAPGGMPNKVAFVTASPCVTCAKLLIQGNISHVFYREIYRDSSGLEVLARADVTPVHYVRWMQEWR